MELNQYFVYLWQIGKSKPAVVDLPPADHIYGIKSNLDCEGAGSVIGGWLEHQ